MRSDRGIDINAGATLTYPGGAVANIAWNQVAWTDNRASIAGDGGRIELPSRFHEPTGLTDAYGQSLETISEPAIGPGHATDSTRVAEPPRAGPTRVCRRCRACGGVAIHLPRSAISASA